MNDLSTKFLQICRDNIKNPHKFVKSIDDKKFGVFYFYESQNSAW
jgi:hypothetical protein